MTSNLFSFDCAEEECPRVKDREDRSGGGLLIAVPSNISAQQIPIQIQQTRELEILAIKIHVRNISFYIVNIYAPRGFNIILIKSFLESLMAPMIIFGDFNLHHPMWGSDHISRYSDEFVEWITDSNLVLLNTTVPTYRSSADATSLLDLTVCSSSISGYCNSYVLDCSFESDHSPIITELSLLNSNKRIFKKVNWQAVMNQTHFIFNNPEVDSENLSDKISHVIANNIREIKVSNRSFPPWWNKTLAICQALDDLVESNVNLLVLSDSLSVLSALQNFSIKSNKVDSVFKDIPKLMPLWHGQSKEDFSKIFLEHRFLDYGGIGIDINLNQTEMVNCVSKHAVDQVGFRAQVCALPFLSANKISMGTDSCLSSFLNLSASHENYKKFCLKLQNIRKTVRSKRRFQNHKNKILLTHQQVKTMYETKKRMKIPVPEAVLELVNIIPETLEIPKVNFDYSGGCLISVQRINSDPILLHPTGKKLNQLAFTTIKHCSEPFSSFKPVKSDRQVIRLGKSYLQQVTSAVDGYCYVRQNGLIHFVDFTDMSKINHFNCLEQNVTNIGASQYCPDELVSADKNGRIELNNISSKKPVWSVEKSVYSESEKDIPRLCSFGAHPKSVLFITERNLFSFDARSEGQNRSLIFSCNHCSCYPDEDLTSVKGLVANPFQHFISSSHHLFLCDERYPQKPFPSNISFELIGVCKSRRKKAVANSKSFTKTVRTCVVPTVRDTPRVPFMETKWSFGVLC
ncbi:uncharacterized protein TNCV_3691281 [Trichonephila clavipes]|nr:uncharacterized protein TNCV_3691281 [Trichonephila clavipes]